MKSLAAYCHALNGPDAVDLIEMQVPPLAAGHVRIAVKAAALNFPDLLMTYGKYQFRPELPFIVGMEGAGVVLEVNSEGASVDPEVNTIEIGARVAFRGKTGAISQIATVNLKDVTPVAAPHNFEQAAAFGVTFQTAFTALAIRGRLQPGEVVLVHGAGGGVGQASVAVACALGTRVIATASSAAKLEIARQSGADHLINYAGADFPQEVMRLTNGAGAALVIDPVGGDAFSRSVDCLGWEGRILTVGFASGSFGQMDLQKLQNRGGEVIGVRAGEFGRRNPAAGRAAQKDLIKLTEAFDLKPYIGKVWQMSEIGEALKAMENRSVLGKQVVAI